MLRGVRYCCGKSSVRLSVTLRYRGHIRWNLEYFENNFTAD